MICNLGLQMNSAIILAGGIGSRLNSDIPKQFIRANNGNRIIDFSIEIFRKNKHIDEIIIVLPKYWMDKYNIPVENIIRHSDCSGDHVGGEGKGKTDPGSAFDWERFQAALVA